MDSLRLILILIGAVIIVAVYLYSRYRKDSAQDFQKSGYQSAQSHLSSNSTTNATSATSSATESMGKDGRTVIVDPSIYSGDSEGEDFKYEDSYNELDDELSELGHSIKIEEGGIGENSPVPDAFIQVEDGPDSSVENQQDETSLVEKVMVIYLLAQSDQEFSGSELVSVANAEGLQFGEDGYFHRYANQNQHSESIFGIANILEPGLFDISAVDDLYTPGLVFFQRLSNAGGALEAFDSMLETIISFRDRLNGRLQDSGRSPLNKSAMIKLREQVAAFSLENQVTPF